MPLNSSLKAKFTKLFENKLNLLFFLGLILILAIIFFSNLNSQTINYKVTPDLTENTMRILTPTGYKKLYEMKAGDAITAYDTKGKQITNKINKIEAYTQDIDPTDKDFTFYLINNTYKFYKNQSIFANNTVTHVKLLKKGDVIYDENNNKIVITTINKTSNPKWYHLDVSGNHAYISDGILLHNASRYVKAGGGNYNSTGTWSATSSAGADNASVPTASDAVIADAGSGQLTVNVASVAASVNFTNYTSTLTMNNTLTVSGTVILVSTMNISGTGGLIVNAATAPNFNGVTWPNDFTFNVGANPTVALNSDWHVAGTTSIGQGATGSATTLNGYTIYTGGLLINSNAGVLGTTNIVLNGTGTWSAITGGVLRNNLNINTAGTLTISGNVYFNTGTLTYTTAGSIVNTGSTLTLGTPNTSINTGSMIWNNVSIGGGNTTFTLGSDLNVAGTLSVGNGTYVTTINGYNINVSGSLSVNQTAGTVNGTTNIIMNGTGTWSSPGETTGVLRNNLTFNTSGTITISGTNNYNTGTLTYTAGTVTTTGSTLNIAASATLNTPTANMHWNNITISGNSTLTLTSGITLDGNLSIGAFTLTLATSDITCNGTLLLTGDAAIKGAGRKLNINGNLSFPYNLSGTATVVMKSSGTLSGAGTLSINLTFDTSGTITVTGTINYNTGTLGYVQGTAAGTGTLHPGTATGFNSGAFVWPNVLLNGENATYTFANDFTAGNLTLAASVNSPAWGMTLSGTHTIYVDGNLAMSGIAPIGVGPSIVFNGTGTQVWSSTNTGLLTTAVSFNFSGSLSLSGSIVYSGTLTYIGGVTTIGGTGTLVAQGATTFNTSSLHFPNITLTAQNTGYTFSSDLNVDGNFIFNSGINSGNWPMSLTGAYNIYVGGNLTVSGNAQINVGATYPSFIMNGTGVLSGNQTMRMPLSVNTSGTVTVTGNFTFNGGILSYSNGTINGTGTIIIGAATTFNSGAGTWPNLYFNVSATQTLSSDLTVSGTLTVANTTTFIGAHSINCGTLLIYGYVLTLSGDVTCATSLTTAGTATINGSGKTVNVTGNLTLPSSLSGTAAIIMNGTGTWSGAGTLSNNLTFNTSGTITVSGTVAYSTGTLTYTTGVMAVTGSTLSLGSCTVHTSSVPWNNLTTNGTINGDTLNIYGNLTVSGTTTGTANMILAGTGTWSGAGALSSNLTINTSGTITVTGTVYYNTGTLTYTAGTVTTTGSTLYIAASTTLNTPSANMHWNNMTIAATLTLTLPSSIALDGNFSIGAYTFTFTSDITALGSLVLTGAPAINGVGRTLSIGGNLALAYGLSGSATIMLAGTGTLSGGGTMTSNLTINTSGTITVTGTINYYSGTITYVAGNTAATGSTINLAGGATFDTKTMVWGNLNLNSTYVQNAGTSNIYTLLSDFHLAGDLVTNTNANYDNVAINGYSMYVGGNLTLQGMYGYGHTYGTTTIILNGTGTWTQTAYAKPYLDNSLTINTAGTITIGVGTNYSSGTITYVAGTVTTAGSTLSFYGSATINTSGMTWNNIAVNGGTLTNNSVTGNGLTVAGGLSGTLVQGINSILTITGSISATLTATATGNTVVYNSTAGAQTVKSTTYNNLTINNTGQTATLGGAITVNGNLNIMAGTLDVSASNYALGLKGNYTNSGVFTARSGTVTLSGTVQQTLSGVMTGLSAFYNLIITNVTGGSPSDCALTNFTPSVIFGSSLTSLGTYTVTTANVRVQYTSGATYTFNNINWNGQASNTKIYFRNSALAGNWHLKVTGTQTAVSYINVSRSDALIGNQIASNNGTNADCGNNINWLFPASSGPGDKLKETGTTHWTSPNTGATNSSHFTALPGGYSFYSLFGAPGPYGFFWTSTYLSTDTANAWNRILSYLDTSVVSNANNRSYAYSVRCVKN